MKDSLSRGGSAPMPLPSTIGLPAVGLGGNGSKF